MTKRIFYKAYFRPVSFYLETNKDVLRHCKSTIWVEFKTNRFYGKQNESFFTATTVSIFEKRIFQCNVEYSHTSKDMSVTV